MPCFKPIHGFHKLGGGIVFTPAGSNSIPLKIPCGQCIGCRTDKKLEWALRLHHESRSHADSIFVTLTYAQPHLPRGGTLVVSHGQCFMRRLRRLIHPHKVRFFLVGEYGDQNQRPHYHVILFGYWPADAKLEGERETGKFYSSVLLSDAWGQKGFVEFSPASPATMKYVSHYAVKRITGDMAKEHYTRLTISGEFVQVIPEFARMSTRPGIGHQFMRDYQEDIRNGDFCLMDGKKRPVPKYYDRVFKREHEAKLEAVKELRREKARKRRANNTPERLATREQVATLKSKFNNGRRSAL
ncbi:MAG: replication initiator protein [Microvirus sp.]|nr:MAG: replication initiator protein [Microvirus sp.]